MRTTTQKKSQERPLTIDQWIEIETINGQTVLSYFPPNEVFERERREMDPPPQLIYRRLHFVNGVPFEYMWTQPDARIRQYGGLCLHRLTPALWASVLHRERQNNHSRVVAPDHYIKRPEAFGPCPCDRCTAERENGES